MNPKSFVYVTPINHITKRSVIQTGNFEINLLFYYYLTMFHHFQALFHCLRIDIDACNEVKNGYISVLAIKLRRRIYFYFCIIWKYAAHNIL